VQLVRPAGPQAPSQNIITDALRDVGHVLAPRSQLALLCISKPGQGCLVNAVAGAAAGAGSAEMTVSL